MTQTPEPRPPIAAAIIVRAGRVLLVRRRVSEGTLSWQFPAGEVEPGESPTDAAVCETREEVGLAVSAVRVLGERVHPATGRSMVYVACAAANGDARVVDDDELADVAWSDHASLPGYVPHGLIPAVQEYLDGTLTPGSA